MDVAFSNAWETTTSLCGALFASITSPAVKLLAGEPGIWDKSFLAESVAAADPLEDLFSYLQLAAIFLAGFVLFRKAVATPLAYVCLANPTEAEATKFADSCVEFTHYLCFTVIGGSCALTLPWTWPSTQWWAGYAEGEQAVMRDDLRCWYIMDAARYSAVLFSIWFLEHRRKDFVEMNVHHLAAIFVTLISYQFDFTRVGAMVKLMMDPADVPLHLAKMCLYMSGGNTKSWAHFCADRIFEIFAVLFFFTRIICYGYIVYATVFEATVYITLPLGGQICVGLLCVLLGLQVFWFSLIVKLAISTKVKGEAIRDNRSDSEGDGDGDGDGDDHEGKKKRKTKSKTAKKQE